MRSPARRTQLTVFPRVVEANPPTSLIPVSVVAIRLFVIRTSLIAPARPKYPPPNRTIPPLCGSPAPSGFALPIVILLASIETPTIRFAVEYRYLYGCPSPSPRPTPAAYLVDWIVARSMRMQQ